MLKFTSIMIGSSSPETLAKVYEKVFEKKPDMQEDKWWGWHIGGCSFDIGEHSEVKGKAKEPQRMILNFEVADVQREFDRIKDIDGITVIKAPYQMEGWDGWIATLADPDGNYFQIMSPWENQ